MKITMLGIVGLFICFCSSGQVFGQPPGTAWADFSNMDGYVNGVQVVSKTATKRSTNQLLTFKDLPLSLLAFITK